MQTYHIGKTEVAEIKRLIGQCVPKIKSSHRVEAMARGLGYQTNAALVDALSQDHEIIVAPDRQGFEDFLAERGHDVEALQLDLLPDAVRLAAGQEWQPDMSQAAGIFYLRCCLQCFDVFPSSGTSNRLCAATKMREGRTPGVQHYANVVGQALSTLFHRGEPIEQLAYLRVRPGWTDILDGAELRQQVAYWQSVRLAVFERRWGDLPEGEKEFRAILGAESYLSQFSWQLP